MEQASLPPPTPPTKAVVVKSDPTDLSEAEACGLFVLLGESLPSVSLESVYTIDEILQRCSEQVAANETSRTKIRFPVVDHDLSAGYFYFQSPLDYYRFCFANHLIVQIRVQDIAFIFSCVISKHVTKHKEVFRSLFTTSEKKEDIEIMSTDQRINLTEILQKVDEVAPLKLMKFMPKFSTDTAASFCARQSAFAEMVSPYYRFITYCCGYRGMRIIGSKEDWTSLGDAIGAFRIIFASVSSPLTDYFHHMSTIVNKFREQVASGIPDLSWLHDFYQRTRCGSGSQEAVGGTTVCQLFNMPQNKRPGLFPSCITTVPYTIKNGKYQGSYHLHYGIHSAQQRGRELIPLYNYVLTQTNLGPQTTIGDSFGGKPPQSATKEE